jgi:peptidoglycan hydrolase-like protein with peptidoglycan-binding domain
MRQGGHTRGYNTTSQAIVVYGDFRYDPVPDSLIAKIGNLVKHGANEGWWPARITHGHKDLGSTSCPGGNLYQAIPTINAYITHGLVPESSDDKEFDHMLDTLGLYDGWKQNKHLRDEVRRMQAWLAVAGHIAANTFDSQHRPDGLFGKGTLTAVTNFQRDNDLTVDGVCGPRTWEALADA